MARQTTKLLQAALRAPFAGRFSAPASAADIAGDHDISNDFAFTWSDAADTTSVEALRVDVDGMVQVNRTATPSVSQKIEFNLAANAALGTQSFFVADRPMLIRNIVEVHSTAGSDAGAVTLQIFKDTATNAPGAGNAVQVGTFNLKATANTPQTASLLAVTALGGQAPTLSLAAGDRLTAVFTGVLTAVAGVVVSVSTSPGFKEHASHYFMNANGSLVTQAFFSANRDLTIVGAQAYWAVAGTDAGAVTIDIQKDTGVSAPGTGTTILAAPISAKTAANTPVVPALTATALSLSLAAGDRISVVYTGALTALAGVVVVVYFAPVYSRIDATFSMAANGSIATQAFFLSNRDYEVLEVSEVHATAGSDAGAVTLDVTIDKGTTAPGAGVSCLANTINAKGTANTTQFVAPTTLLHSRLLKAGDRLSIKTTGVLTALANVVVTASIRPR